MTKVIIYKNSEEYMEAMRIKREKRDFLKNMRNFIVTTRFNNETWNENIHFRKRNKLEKGCVYCSPEPIGKKMINANVIFVLEMNNERNQIMGIGMIKNQPTCGRYRVYQRENYNRYVYMGKYRVDRTEMTEKEEEVIKVLDHKCFKGNRHSKRGQGFKLYPIDFIFDCRNEFDLVGFISQMFKDRYVSEKKEETTITTVSSEQHHI
jgi:hypothetical protein